MNEGVGPGELLFTVTLGVLALIGLMRGVRSFKRNRAGGRPVYGSLAWMLTMASLVIVFAAGVAIWFWPASRYSLTLAAYAIANLVFWAGVGVGIVGFVKGFAKASRG